MIGENGQPRNNELRFRSKTYSQNCVGTYSLEREKRVEMSRLISKLEFGSTRIACKVSPKFRRSAFPNLSARFNGTHFQYSASQGRGHLYVQSLNMNLRIGSIRSYHLSRTIGLSRKAVEKGHVNKAEQS